MKKYLGISILIFFLFCTNSSADVVEDLKNFEKSLSEWLDNTDKLDQKLLSLEGNINAKDKQFASIQQSIGNIENLLNGLNERLGNVENLSSETGVGKIIKIYEKTLEIFKKRLSRMAKRVEDTEVKTAVLERIYQTSQKPLETLMKTIDEQNKVIGDLSKRIDLQGKTMLAMEVDARKQTAPSESFTKNIEELNKRIADLESGTVALTRMEKRVEVEQEAGMKQKEVAATQEVSDEKGPETMGFVDMGKGFFIKNVGFKPFGSSSYIKGEILNKSGRDYSISDFKVRVYDAGNVLLGEQGFSIKGFRMDSTKTFEEIIVGIEPGNISKYAILFVETAVLVSVPVEDVIKIIERKKPTVTVQKIKSAEKTKEELSEGEEDILAAGLEIEKPEELEGFEDVGNGFYAGKVSFASFGSSSTVTGEIKNNSEKDYYSASFVMKVYSKNYGMITSFDFSVRRLKSGETKPFEEIVAGVSTVDISRYEILFKKSY